MRERLVLFHSIVKASLSLMRPLQQDLVTWEEPIGARMQVEPAWAWSEMRPLGARISMMVTNLCEIREQVSGVMVEARDMIGPLMIASDLQCQAMSDVDELRQLIQDSILLMDDLQVLQALAARVERWHGRLERALPPRPPGAWRA